MKLSDQITNRHKITITIYFTVLNEIQRRNIQKCFFGPKTKVSIENGAEYNYSRSLFGQKHVQYILKGIFVPIIRRIGQKCQTQELTIHFSIHCHIVSVTFKTALSLEKGNR